MLIKGERSRLETRMLERKLNDIDWIIGGERSDRRDGRDTLKSFEASILTVVARPTAKFYFAKLARST